MPDIALPLKVTPEPDGGGGVTGGLEEPPHPASEQENAATAIATRRRWKLLESAFEKTTYNLNYPCHRRR